MSKRKDNVQPYCIDLSVPGLEAKLYRVAKDSDEWNFHCGGYYHWNVSLDGAMLAAQAVMIRVLSSRVQAAFASTMRCKNYKELRLMLHKKKLKPVTKNKKR
jgi:hypothetical protein